MSQTTEVITREVITHHYTDGARVDACSRHESAVRDFSAGGASYSGASHGAHTGICDFCREDHRASPSAAPSQPPEG